MPATQQSAVVETLCGRLGGSPFQARVRAILEEEENSTQRGSSQMLKHQAGPSRQHAEGRLQGSLGFCAHCPCQSWGSRPQWAPGTQSFWLQGRGAGPEPGLVSIQEGAPRELLLPEFLCGGDGPPLFHNSEAFPPRPGARAQWTVVHLKDSRVQ